MLRRPHLPVIIACLIILAVVSGCKKPPIEKNTAGPGGLPRGLVEQGTTQMPETGYPVYPGSVLQSVGVYKTTDPISTVENYYTELLEIEPESDNPDQQMLTFVTGEFTLVCLPLPDDGGTEIRFTPVVEGEGS
jgi:hypothetical protein